MMDDDIRRRPRLDGKLTFPEIELIQELNFQQNQGMSRVALESLVVRHISLHGGLSLEGQEEIYLILDS